MKRKTRTSTRLNRKVRNTLRLEPLEGRLLLHGEGVDQFGPLHSELLQSMRSFLSSVQGVSESGSSLVESLPLLCGGPVAEAGQSVTDAPLVGPVAWSDVDLGGISCCCPACLAVADVDFAEATPVVNSAGPVGATVPLSSVPILNSLTGAAVSLYLNFVGRFDAFWGSYSNVTTPAFDQDGDATTFSSGELDAIQTIWSIVAEDYAPFNINVTTVAPPSLANGVAVSVAIGGNGSWTGGTYGGIAYTDSFTSFMPNLGFVFSSNLGNNPKSVGDTVSHEAGHTFGLLHQSQYDAGGNLIREYSTGPGDGRAPIMGNSAAATRGLWWNGTTSSSSTLQNDMAVIASVNNGFGYRPDDHGNSAAAATNLTLVGTQLSGSGIIETTSDQDYFSFSTAAGQITLSVDVMAGIANLDARLELRDAVGVLIASAAPTDSFSASLTTTVAAGSYRLVVASQGGYGDVGQYAVSGTIVAGSGVAAPTGLSAVAAAGPNAQLAWTDNANNETYYEVWRSPDGSTWALLATLAADANHYTDTTVTANSTYYYRVRAGNISDASANSNQVQLTLPPLANQPPSGTDKSITLLEDATYTLTASDFGFSDATDSPPNSLLAVKIATSPAAGSLTRNGVAVSIGQFISVADITAGLLRFTPVANASGAGYTSFSFQVQDDGGTANGGIDLDPTPNSITFNVTSINDAPSGTNKAITLLEDVTYTFAVSDFGFSDPSDSPANSLLAVRISTLPAAGLLTRNGVAVTVGQFITAVDIAAGLLRYTPPANANGASYASFSFQVQDNGGTASGGVDLDPTPNSITLGITSVNDAPSGTNKSISLLEDTSYTFTASDFGFSDSSDSPANSLLTVRISTLPAAGSLTRNGVAVTVGQFITVADITAGMLRYTPPANANGSGYANFSFQVQDDGGTANGGVDLDPTPNTITINVTAVNDAPSGTNKTITLLEDATYTFTTGDFGFSDSGDSPANSLLAVRISTLPAAGSLTRNGVAVTAGQFITLAEITAGSLRYTPPANANGSAYASFSFQVQDNGGTANGGVDLDPTPRALTVNVTAVNDAPSGTNATVATPMNTPYIFSVADFGFGDGDDSPSNALLAVRITTLPTAGTLARNGVNVTLGQFITAADLAVGLLRFTPATNASGANYASFTFQVQDNGGTANGGVALDPSPNTIAIHVLPVNRPPAGANRTINTTEDTVYVLTVGDFGFSDPNDSPANSLLAVKITTLPTAGTLTHTGVAVSAGQFISAADIAAGLLRFTPAANATGSNHASVTFQVQDNGGTANGGVDLDPTPNTITFSVSAVNDPPTGTDKTVTTQEDVAYTFVVADFGFSDPSDTPANALVAVKITTLPTAGQLTNRGIAVTAGEIITAADIAGGQLKFMPAANPIAPNSASLTFQVQDNGGTANGGVDMDPTPKTLTVNATVSANQNYVRALYQDILRRAADSGGLRDWTNQLNNGASRTQIATGLWNCREHRGIQVDGYYQQFLHRAADPGGRQFWIQSMMNGMSEETAMTLFMTTIEYQQRNPLNGSFVSAIFQDLLGRAPTVAELAERTSALAGNTQTPLQVAKNCLNSNERHLQLVDSYYQLFFNRQADPGGRSFWTGQLDQGKLSDRGVAIALMATPEYFNRSQVR